MYCIIFQHKERGGKPRMSSNWPEIIRVVYTQLLTGCHTDIYTESKSNKPFAGVADMLEWSDKFTTQIDSVDTQHRRLFDLLNELADALKSGDLGEKTLDEALNRLVDYAHLHFVDEELLMVQKKIDPRLLSMQRMEHKSFIYDIQRIRENFFNEGDTFEQSEKLIRFTTLWLTYHILGTDMDMAAQLKAIEHGVSPEQAYEEEHAKKRDNMTTRLMLDAVLKQWYETTERCRRLEEELNALKNPGRQTPPAPPLTLKPL